MHRKTKKQRLEALAHQHSVVIVLSPAACARFSLCSGGDAGMQSHDGWTHARTIDQRDSPSHPNTVLRTARRLPPNPRFLSQKTCQASSPSFPIPPPRANKSPHDQASRRGNVYEIPGARQVTSRSGYPRLGCPPPLVLALPPGNIRERGAAQQQRVYGENKKRSRGRATRSTQQREKGEYKQACRHNRKREGVYVVQKAGAIDREGGRPASMHASSRTPSSDGRVRWVPQRRHFVAQSPAGRGKDGGCSSLNSMYPRERRGSLSTRLKDEQNQSLPPEHA